MSIARRITAGAGDDAVRAGARGFSRAPAARGEIEKEIGRECTLMNANEK